MISVICYYIATKIDGGHEKRQTTLNLLMHLSAFLRSARHLRLPHGKDRPDKEQPTSGGPVCDLYSKLVQNSFNNFLFTMSLHL